MASATGDEDGAPGRRPKTLILDVYGRYVAQFGGWVAVADLIELMGLMGVDGQAVRSAVSRMTRRGLLRPEVRAGVRGYATTAEADEVLADADRRIYRSIEPATLAEGWVLASFSVPESERDRRHLLRSRLTWRGMGNVSAGLWIGPARLLDDVVDTVRSLDLERYVDVFRAHHAGMGDAADLVRRCWDLDALGGAYRDFVARWRPLGRGRIPSDAEAFASYTLALHDWRKFPYLDPGLPAEVLPARWAGREAQRLFASLRERLEPAAFRHAAAVVAARVA